MAHKQPDFRQNQNPASRSAAGEGGRTDEVIGRFQQPAASGPLSPESPAREEPARGGGLGRFFRAASERLGQGRSRTREPERSTFEPGQERGYGQRYGADPGFEQGSDPGFNERQTRLHQTPEQEARDIQRRGYPEVSYGGGLREDRGLYSDFGRGEGRGEPPRPDFGRRADGQGFMEAGAPRRGRWQREPLTAQEIMTRNPRAVRRESPLRDAAQIMRDENVGIVPVVDEGLRLVGVLTDRDVVVRAFVDERQPASLRVADVMTDDVEAVTPEESIHEIIELMGRKQIRRVPVVDREDRLLGIIAMADVANRAAQDEELQAALERISARRSFWHRLT